MRNEALEAKIAEYEGLNPDFKRQQWENSMLLESQQTWSVTVQPDIPEGHIVATKMMSIDDLIFTHKRFNKVSK
tara:strand:+ start:8724 stop:8945 length:222 start_codon:yes stop_codon:yes gene_type:complete